MTPTPTANSDRLARFAVALTLLLLPLIYFFPAVLRQVALVPGDGLTQNYGVRILIGQMLASGIAPLWNPYIFAGTPLLASIYPGALYPPNWLFALLSAEMAMQWVVITTYHIALIGTYLYGRRIGMSRVGALLAGLVFSFGGYMIAHLGHTSRIAAGAWLPWVLLAVEHLYQRASWRWVTAGAVIIALQLFAGEPQMNCYTALVAGAYVLFSLALREERERRWRFIAGLAAMGVCGLLLSMIQLLPERELLQQGERAQIPYEYFAQYSFPPRQVLTLVFPYFFGGAGMDPYKVSYWGQWSLSEVCGYTGMVGLLLAFTAVLAPRRSRLIWFWAAAALAALILSFGSYLPFNLNWLLFHVPVYNLFRASGRHMFDFTFGIAILAGLGASYLMQRDAKEARRALLRGTIVMAAIVALTAIAYRFFWPSRPAGANFLSNQDAFIPIIFFVLSAALAWLFLRRPRPWAGALVVLVLIADLWSFGAYFEWRLFPYSAMNVTDPPTVQAVKQREPDLNSFRVISHALWPYNQNYHTLNYPNVSIARGLQSVNGYDALRLPRVAAVGGDMTIDGLMPDFSAFSRHHQGLNLLNVKYLFYERQSRQPGKTGEAGKTHDGIFFNATELNLRLGPETRYEMTPGGVAATELAIVSTMGRAAHLADGAPVLSIKLETTDGRVIEQQLQAGRDTAEWAYDRADVRPVIKHRRPPVVESWQEVDYQGHRYLARLKFDRAQIARVELKYLLAEAELDIVRASLFDAETGGSTTLDAVNLPSERWRKVGDFDQVELYENLKALPRAWFVKRIVVTPRDEVLQAIRTGKLKQGELFDPAETALMEREDFGNRRIETPPVGDPAGAAVKVTRYEPHRIELTTRNGQPGFLVLSEIYYRGWEAWLDGKRVPVERTNYTLRGVAVPAGEHRLEFVFRAHSFRNGAVWSLLGVILLLAGVGIGYFDRTREGRLTAHVVKLAARLRKFVLTRWVGLGLLALAVIYGAVLIKHASYAVGGADSSGYATIARSLLQGRVLLPIPELDEFNFPANYGPIFSTLPHIARQGKNGPEKARLSPIYPVGFPLHLAGGAALLGWKHGPFLISPLLGILSLVFLYLIALRLGLPRAFALAGAVILAANPTFIFMALQPMSDVTALFWALALIWAGFRSHDDDRWAAVAGAAFGMAFLVRPTNILLLVPLAFCLRLKPKPLLFFVLGGLPLAAVFLGYNYAAYGHPLQTGYGAINLQGEMAVSGYGIRFQHYMYWLAMTMSPLLLIGWLGVAVNRLIKGRDRALLIAWFGAFLLFYCGYKVYEDWWYTRFLLPGYPGLILGALMTAQWLFGTWLKEHRYVRWIACGALLAVALGFAGHYDRKFGVFRTGRGHAIHADSCRWADARVPARAVIVVSEMSGAMKFYTDRLILRWDMIPPELWVSVKTRIQGKGYEFYALLMQHEVEAAQKRVLGEWTEKGQLGALSLWHILPLEKAPPVINYAEGFSGLERNPEGISWRWMSDEGLVQLENTGEPMRLRIEGNAPLDSLARPGTFKISLNGALLDQATLKKNPMQKEFLISPAQQGEGKWSELRISTDQIFVPNQIDPANADQRRLGFSLTGLTWEALSAKR